MELVAVVITTKPADFMGVRGGGKKVRGKALQWFGFGFFYVYSQG